MASFKDYDRYDALGLAELVRKRQVSPIELLEAAIERVDSLNPTINAIVHRMDDEARRAIAAGLPDGPFRGVPFALKDLYQLYAGQPTRNGSRSFADYVADHDTTLTERYKAAGLVIMAKTSTPEFGLNMTTEPALHGATRNPWNTSLSAGGSSGGAAAAVASGMLPAAHATDGGGSIRIPAANCGLVGLKPTRARLPAGPDVGEGWSGLATGHVVTRSVRDSAAFLDATHGPAPGDPYCAPAPKRPFLADVGADPGRLRIALITEGARGETIDAVCKDAARDAGKLCESLGHRVESTTYAYDAEGLVSALRTIIAANVKNALVMRGTMRGRAVGENEVERATWALAEEGARLSAADYARAIQIVHRTGRQLAAFMENCDVILSPTLGGPPFKLGTIDMMGPPERYFDALAARIPFTPLYNATGHPALSIPLYWTADGIPIGVHIGARFGDEATLFRLASQLEAAQPWAQRYPAHVAA